MKINKREIKAATTALNIWSNRPTRTSIYGKFEDGLGHYFSFYRRFELCVIDYDGEVKLVYKGKSKKDLWNFIESLIKKAKEVNNV